MSPRRKGRILSGADDDHSGSGGGKPDPILNIVGNKVALGPHRRELLPLYWRWINDFAVTRTLAIGWRPMSWEAEVDWYERVSISQTDTVFTIYERATLRPIGSAGLHKIDHLNRTAEFGIMIGDTACWGQGYGTETTVLMLDYGFDALNLHNILLWTYSSNERGIRAYTRAGFRMIGRRREALHRGGETDDIVLMDCLATDDRPGRVARSD